MGPLAPAGFFVRRSGFRWLCKDGDLCRAGQAIAYCGIGLTADGSPRTLDFPFKDEEWYDLQVVIAPRVAGRIRRAESSSRGGFLDQLDLFQYWTPDFVVGHLDPVAGVAEARSGNHDEVELLVVTGRRRAEIADSRSGLLSGWHDRTRAWQPRDDAAMGSVLSLGTCEQDGVLRGGDLAFFDLFEAISGPAHAIFAPDFPLVPSARILLEQMLRSETDYEAIAEDLVTFFAAALPRPGPAEWIFVGALLNHLRRASLTESYDIFSRGSVGRAGPADSVVMSLGAEAGSVYRHKRLNYILNLNWWRVVRAGPTLRRWLEFSFERRKVTIDDVANDYRALIGAMRVAPDRAPKQLLVLNIMSTSGEDEIQNYAAFDTPMSDTLASIHAKDMNLMLHDLARDWDVAIVDSDAIAAEIGGQRNLPDGTHASGALQTEIRGEILHILHARGVPGFAPIVDS